MPDRLHNSLMSGCSRLHSRRVRFVLLIALLPLLVLIGCEPLSLNPTPITVIITPVPTRTPPPTATFTPSPSPTPQPSATPFLEPTNTPFPCEEDGGQLIDIDDNRSAIAGENLRYKLYLPPCYYQTARRYPVVYLLHGLAATEDQWANLGLAEVLDQGIRLDVLAPMIVVMPYMGNIGTYNQFPPEPSYETVLLEELRPQVETDLCTWNEREYRAIGGISRGGFWAYSIALRHPDIFGVVGGHSAVFPQDTSVVPAAFNPLEIALNSSFLEGAGLRMYLDNGADDSVGVGQQLFSSRLSARGIAHRYVINPVGDHDEEYWSAHVSEYLTFYAQGWPSDTAQLPSCLEPSP